MGRLRGAYRFLSSMGLGLLLLAALALYLAIASIYAPDTYAAGLGFKLLAGASLVNMALCTGGQLWRFLRAGRGRLRPLLLLLLHGGIVLAALGMVLGQALGFSNKFALFEGESAALSACSRGRLEGLLRLDAFSMPLSPEGRPLQYLAQCSLLDGAGEAQSLSIAVNRPAKFGSSKLYYAEYMDGIHVLVHRQGLTDTQVLGKGEFLDLGACARRLQVYGYYPDYDPEKWYSEESRAPHNPTVVFYVYDESGGAALKSAPLGSWVGLGEDLSICFSQVRPYVVFRYKFDPGLGPAAAGGGLILLSAAALPFAKREQRRRGAPPAPAE